MKVETDNFSGRLINEGRGFIFDKSLIEARVERYFTKYGLQTLIRDLQIIESRMEPIK